MNKVNFASIEELKDARIGVFGLGVTGKAACKLAKAGGAKLIVVNQTKEDVPGCDVFLTQDDERAGLALAECDVILLSPGIPRNHSVLTLAHENSTPIWNEIELAFRILRKPLGASKWLAITGTNGKTTTVTLVGEMLKADGRGVFVGGNIGTPLSELALQIINKEISPEKYPATIVLELSSFQLESLVEFRPHGAAILNISASHGERYDRIRDYAEAKGHIVDQLGAGDIFLSLKDDVWTEKVVRAGSWLWERVDPNQLSFDEVETNDYRPFGRHNLVNLAFAIRLAKVAGASIEAIQNVVNTFTGVPFRLERVFENDEKLVLNDSKSTNWASTLAAINSVRADERWGKKQITLLVGGKCRGHNDLPEDEIIEKLDHFGVAIHFFGEFAQKYKAELQAVFPQAKFMARFSDLVKSWDGSGVLLFSPAFPSFDEFKSYSDRGEQFSRLVKA